MTTPTPPLLSTPDPVVLYGNPYESPPADDIPILFEPYAKYPAGFVIQQAGTLYSATVAFTAGATFNASNWTVVGSGATIDGGSL